MIVGKAVSKTDHVLVGHNEDNGGRIMTQQHWVPAATHAKGETIKFEPAAAMIPQVEKTFGFYWSQTYSPSGSSFSDGFVNENGVVIATNACTGIYDDRMEVKDGGIGYGIRRLIAERATSARHAVDIAIDLLTTYGYFSEGRTYTIADSKEAWQIAIHQGNTWVARRVKDNEIVYIPNNFMMDRVDATDTENVIVAPGMIERAIKNGRYKPAKEGVYSDFNYRVAVAPAHRRAAAYNAGRNNLAWKIITGKDITDPEQFPYSYESDKMYGVEDVQTFLRAHEVDIDREDPDGWYHSNAYGVCRSTTHESAVYDIDENSLLIAGFRALLRPCESPFIPFYPLARSAEGTAFMGWEQATAEHFKGTPEFFSYNPDWAVSSFVRAGNVYDWQRQDRAGNADMIAKMEAQWMKDRAAVEAQARALLKVSDYKATEFLHAYNQNTFNEARAKVDERIAKIAPHSMNVLAASIGPKSDKTVDLVGYSDRTLYATKLNADKTWAGVGRDSMTNLRIMKEHLAQPVKTEKKDVNGDGKLDLVMSFTQKDLAKNMLPGATFDIWVPMQGNERIAVMDTAIIETEGYKGPQKETQGADL